MTVFSAGQGPTHQKAIVGFASASYGDYAAFHWAAAQALVADVEAEREPPDLLFYSIGYLYRHALELGLKHVNLFCEANIRARVAAGLLPTGSQLSQQETEKELRKLKRHELLPLLERLEKRLTLLDDCEGLSADARAAIAEVEAFDEDGERLRYPSRSGGRGRSFDPFGPDGQLLIDVGAIRDALDPVLNELVDGFDGWLSHDIEVTREYSEEMEPNVN